MTTSTTCGHAGSARSSGTGQSDGWLDHVDLADARVRHLLDDLREFVTVLCWLAIRPDGNARERVVSWQPYLRAALEKDLIDVTDDTIELLAAAGHLVTADRAETDFLQAMEFIDDDLWCRRSEADLALDRLSLAATSTGQRTSVRLTVGGIVDPLLDPRLPTLIVAVRRYRSTDAVALFGTDPDWRVALTPGHGLAFKASLSAPVVNAPALEEGAIEALAADRGVLADLLPAGTGVA